MANYVLSDFAGADDEARLRTAISTLLVHDGYNGVHNELVLPDDEVVLDDGSALDLNVASDMRARLTIRGKGRRGTIIRQTTSHGCMDVGATGDTGGVNNNIRDLQLIDITFQGGTYGLDLQEAFYCDFVRLSFTLHTSHAVKVHSTSNTSPCTTLTDPWIVHCTGKALYSTGGWLKTKGGIIGEDVGAVEADDGEVWLEGTSVFSKSGLARDGVLIAKAAGQVYADNCFITAYDNEYILHTTNARRCRLANCRLVMGNRSNPIYLGGTTQMPIEYGNDIYQGTTNLTHIRSGSVYIETV